MADDLGFSDLGCYGGEIDTPNIDRLAAEGMRFSQFYNCGVCRTSRVALLTGLHPRRIKGRLLHDNMTTLAEVVQSSGYRTSLIGKWHFPVTKPADRSRLPTRRGFEHFYGLAAGCCNYFDPAKPFPDFYRGQGPEPFLDQETPVTRFPPDYYTTDAFTDRAVKQIEAVGSSRRTNRRSFCISATPPRTIRCTPSRKTLPNTRGISTTVISRCERTAPQRLRQLGLIDPQWKLSKPDPQTSQLAYDYAITPWESIKTCHAKNGAWKSTQRWWIRWIRGLAVSWQAIERAGISDNTCVMFLSDNGGCASHSGYHDCGDQEAARGLQQGTARQRRHVRLRGSGLGLGAECSLSSLQGLDARRRHFHTHDRALAGCHSSRVAVTSGRSRGRLHANSARCERCRLSRKTKQMWPCYRRMGSVCCRCFEGGTRAVTSRSAGISTAIAPCVRENGNWSGEATSRNGNSSTWSQTAPRRTTLPHEYPQRVEQMEADWLQWAKRTGAPLKGTAL